MALTHVFFSPGGETAQIAHYLHKETGGSLINLTSYSARDQFDTTSTYEHIILYIPVYSGHVPKPLLPILSALQAKRLSLIITYGGVTTGIALHEAAKAIAHTTLVSYAMVPVNHTYGEHQNPIDMRQLEPLIQVIKLPSNESVTLPKKRWPFWFDWTEPWRTRFNYRLKHHPNRCTQCGRCQQTCPVAAITKHYQLKRRCLRCGRCVRICEKHAWTAKQSWFLKRYLRKPHKASFTVCFHLQDRHP